MSVRLEITGTLYNKSSGEYSTLHGMVLTGTPLQIALVFHALSESDGKVDIISTPANVEVYEKCNDAIEKQL